MLIQREIVAKIDETQPQFHWTIANVLEANPAPTASMSCIKAIMASEVIHSHGQLLNEALHPMKQYKMTRQSGGVE